MSSNTAQAALTPGFASSPGTWQVPLLAATFFLLSADLANFTVAGFKLKYGYILVIGLWTTAPAKMASLVAGAARRIPWAYGLPLLPLAISIATSANVRNSLAWTCWLGFDAFTLATVYAFLKAHAFLGDDVRRALTWSLAMVAAAGVVQFLAIYGWHRPLLSPQLHFGIYRLNGVSGWPHFLNIFAFLMLPLVVVQRRLSWTVKGVLTILLFVLVQSTAKTGWILFVAFGALLLLFDRRVFVRNYLLFLLPVTLVLLTIPLPSATQGAPPLSGATKMEQFSADLDVTDKRTSGTDRVLVNLMGLHVWWRHPWFGVGPRAYDNYVRSRFDAELPGVNKLDANGNVNSKSENIWIELLSECGLLFTLAFAAVLFHALRVPRFAFANRLHLGAWIALVMYFCISGQVSQNALLTMVYATFGCYLYARELSGEADIPPARLASDAA